MLYLDIHRVIFIINKHSVNLFNYLCKHEYHETLSRFIESVT